MWCPTDAVWVADPRGGPQGRRWGVGGQKQGGPARAARQQDPAGWGRRGGGGGGGGGGRGGGGEGERER